PRPRPPPASSPTDPRGPPRTPCRSSGRRVAPAPAPTPPCASASRRLPASGWPAPPPCATPRPLRPCVAEPPAPAAPAPRWRSAAASAQLLLLLRRGLGVGRGLLRLVGEVALPLRQVARLLVGGLLAAQRLLQALQFTAGRLLRGVDVLL